MTFEIPDQGRPSRFFDALDRTRPEVEAFAFGDHPIRVVLIDGDPWFVLADLCRALDLSAVGRVAGRLDEGVRQTHTLPTAGGPQQMTIVSEAGMYEVVIRSDKPDAAAFRRWVTNEVLPSIRRTGAYVTPDRLPDRKTLARWVIEAEERAEREAAARLEAERRAAELEAPASAWQHMTNSVGDYSVADAAKVLSRDPRITIGRDRLFAFMAAQGWVYRDRGTGRWRAYQTQVNAGRLVEKLGSPYLHEPSGEMRLPDPTIRVTCKGLQELHTRLGGVDRLPAVGAVQ